MSGAAGIISNANDMVSHGFLLGSLILNCGKARWLQFLILQGRDPITNKSIIPEEVIKQTTMGMSITSSGLGWDIIDFKLLDTLVPGPGHTSAVGIDPIAI